MLSSISRRIKSSIFYCPYKDYLSFFIDFKIIFCYSIFMTIDSTKPIPSLSDLGISELPEQPLDLGLSELPDSAAVETEIPLEEKVSQKAPSVASRVKSAAILVFGSLFILMWSALNFWWAGIAKAISYHNHKTLHDGIEKAQIKKLLEGLELVVEGEQLGQIADVAG
jgi:hypothetical protein